MSSPGTVSKILWHFTGGPTWDENAKSQSDTPKPEKQAYDNLISILRERTLRLGNYKEILKLILPEYRRFNIKTKKPEVIKNKPIEITGSPVCCLADIPIMHLAFHGRRYGRFAIGYYRSSIIKQKFNPVLYAIEQSKILQSIYNGFDNLNFMDPLAIEMAVDEITSSIISSNSLENTELVIKLNEIKMEAKSISDSIKKVNQSLSNITGFIKTFNESQFQSIFCEREWRSLELYNFSFDDISMIVIPRNGIDNTKYFDNFINDEIPKLQISRAVPIIPWDDLIEQ